MGRFATGVTVLTLTVDNQMRGMTANAICSLSLDPVLLLVCINRKASAYPLFERADAFAVNILSAEQRPLSDFFAQHDVRSMGNAHYRRGTLGSPLLEDVIA